MIKWNSWGYRGTSGGKKPFIIREPVFCERSASRRWYLLGFPLLEWMY